MGHFARAKGKEERKARGMSQAKATWQKDQKGKVTASPEVSKENRKAGDIKDSAGHWAGQDTSRQSVSGMWTMWMRMMADSIRDGSSTNCASFACSATRSTIDGVEHDNMCTTGQMI